MVMITKQIILDAKRFDTNPKKLYFGPNKTKVLVNLEDYLKEFTQEEISSFDKTSHYCMAWMYIGDLKKSDEIFDQTGIRLTNNTEVGFIPIKENGWKIGKQWDWAIMVVVNPQGELIGYRNGRRRTFNIMDLDVDWLPVNVRVDYGESTSPTTDKILSGSVANAGVNKKVRDTETVIMNGIAIIKANEDFKRSIKSIEKLVKSPYPHGLDVYRDFTDRNGQPTKIINGIYNRTADSDDLTRIMDNKQWGEWYESTILSSVYSLDEIQILCTDGVAYEGVFAHQILKGGSSRKPWFLYSRKDSPTEAVKSVSEFISKLTGLLNGTLRLHVELGLDKDLQELPLDGRRPWNILGVGPLLNNDRYKLYYENGMLIPLDEFLQFNTTNLYELCDAAKDSVDNALLGEAA